MTTKGWPIDPSDPRAPPEDVWRGLSAAEQARVYAALPSEFPRTAPPEGDPHRLPKTRALEALGEYFRRIGRGVYLGSELPVYYPGEPMFAPDLIAVSRALSPHETRSLGGLGVSPRALSPHETHGARVPLSHKGRGALVNSGSPSPALPRCGEGHVRAPKRRGGERARGRSRRLHTPRAVRSPYLPEDLLQVRAVSTRSPQVPKPSGGNGLIHHRGQRSREAVRDARLHVVDIVAERYAGVRLSEATQWGMVQVRLTDPFRFVVVGVPAGVPRAPRRARAPEISCASERITFRS